MEFAWNEEQEELRAAARGFLADHSTPEQVREAMASELGYAPEVWKQIGAELGWTSVIVPEAYGGLGLGWAELVALLEVSGESLLCAPFFSSVCLGANAILAAGNEDQKQALLPGIAEGQTRATLAWVGADGAFEPAEAPVVSRREGDGYVLGGRLRHVLDGHCADLVIVAARRDGVAEPDALELFAVPSDTAGLLRRTLPTVDQARRLAELELSNVRVPASARLGDDDSGGAPLRKILDRAAVGLAAEQVGGAQRCLDLSVAYAKERVQFGRAIGSFQAIKHKCADMMVLVEAARSAAYYAGCVAGEDREDLPAVASLAKAYCSDAYFRCAAEALQIHGGVGFTWEYDVHLYFKRAKSSESFLGSPAWHRERVAREIGLGDVA